MDQARAFQAEVASYSEAGIKSVNEDCTGYAVPDNHLLTTKGAVAVVADGVSSAEAGKEAAERCVKAVVEDYFETPETWSVKHAIQKILSSLNLELYNLGHTMRDESKGYISTLSLVVVKSHIAYIFHIGDSRVYHLSKESGEMVQLTRDHCANISEKKNYLVRAMGMDNSLNVDVSTMAVSPGDLFFLSSDGVHDFLSDNKLKMLLQVHRQDVELACQEIAKHALNEGSDDNISCTLMRIDQLGVENIEDLNERLTRLPFPPELSPGARIDGYRVEEELYASERSQLYLVVDEDTGQRLVMKTPSENYSDDPAYIERFIMEEWIGRRIDHPNVVKVIAPKTNRQFLYYLMEELQGVTLQVWLQQHPQARPSVLIGLAEKICAGIEAMHAQQTVHQDLKPSNVMLLPQANGEHSVKIVDFGSVYTPAIHELFSPVDREMALGTLDYADPLYRFGINTGRKGDVYSLGVIIYEMFTGFLPYGTHPERCHNRQDFEEMPYTHSFHHRDIIPLWFDQALQKAVDINPDERYDTPRDLLHDLKNPNPEFLREVSSSPAEKNTLLFWKLLSVFWLALLLVVILLVTSA